MGTNIFSLLFFFKTLEKNVFRFSSNLTSVHVRISHSRYIYILSFPTSSALRLAVRMCVLFGVGSCDTGWKAVQRSTSLTTKIITQPLKKMFPFEKKKKKKKKK